MDTFYKYLVQVFKPNTNCLGNDFKQQYNLYKNTHTPEENEHLRIIEEKHIRDKEFSEKLERHVKLQHDNIRYGLDTLEQCIISNTKDVDTTKPYDKTFTCDFPIFNNWFKPDSFEMYTKQELCKEHEVDTIHKHLNTCNLSSANSANYEKYFSCGKPDKLDNNIIGKNKFMMFYNSTFYRIGIRVSNTLDEVPTTLDEILHEYELNRNNYPYS